ncbi:hypothetical protein QR680_009550 [Steinernema hermaphroditum]|uniref:Uncharacterized protein n=1 Tax=Steinernema hermaphroditum TaxID=289476 RepID=A0AA39M931_9BILA|nr:hypothetical protein QR680_009550 [Steinernema hermaphroditum]
MIESESRTPPQRLRKDRLQRVSTTHSILARRALPWEATQDVERGKLERNAPPERSGRRWMGFAIAEAREATDLDAPRGTEVARKSTVSATERRPRVLFAIGWIEGAQRDKE